ncbi:MAG: DctP family transporter solute-binding subunit [Clostridiales bacterium]|nr:DctP family transporter solute-binding subunit [Clostridiales bacterium]
MIRRLICITTLIAFMTAFSGCTFLGSGKEAGGKSSTVTPATSSKTSNSNSTKAEFILRLGHDGVVSNPVYTISQKYANWVNEQSNGRIWIEIYPSETIGTLKQMTQMLAMGTLDLLAGSQAINGGTYAPKSAAIELPFLFDSYEKVEKVLDGPIGEGMSADLPSKGIRLLAYWENGFRQFTNNKRPIEKPENMKGLKMRSPETKTTISLLKALGASPGPLSFSELYLALSQGVFDGQENPISNIYSAKFYEVQKYISIVNYKYEPRPMMISESTWRKLPDDLKKILKDGAIKFAKEHRKMVKETEEGMLKEMEKNGIKVSKPDLAPFREATKGIYTEWESFIGKETINAVKEAAK